MRVWIAAICIWGAGLAVAKPAGTVWKSWTQKSGSVEVRLRGDEALHWGETRDGYAVAAGKGGFWFYVDAQGQASAYQAHNEAGRDSAESAFLSTLDTAGVKGALEARRVQARYDYAMHRERAGKALLKPAISPLAKGNPRVPVLLVAFSDQAFGLSNPQAEFRAYMDTAGYSHYGMKGSVKEYFAHNSAGSFNPDFDVYGPVTLSHPVAYYGGNDGSNWDSNAVGMVSEALQALDGSIDYTRYDNDQDGEVDFVYVFYAGKGESDGGVATTIWPHAASVTGLSLDGVSIGRYATSNEWSGSAGSSFALDGIGTFCHEFAHMLGLTDLYMTNGASAGRITPLYWDLMDVGVYNCPDNSYNIDGCAPPQLSSFQRYSLGWLNPDTLYGGDSSHSMQPLDSNKAYLVPTDNADEFFLLENRRQRGWDVDVPGHGLLVWHVDYVEDAWANNTVNNSENHFYVDLVEADGLPNVLSQAGDAFPGSAQVSSLVLSTWASAQAGPELYGIEESGDTLLFATRGGTPAPAPLPPAPEPVPSPLQLLQGSESFSYDPLDRLYRLDGRLVNKP